MAGMVTSLGLDFARRLDPAALLAECGLRPDPHQVASLRSTHKRQIKRWTRQGGKTRAAAVKADHKAIYQPGSQTVILSANEEKAKICYGAALDYYHRISGAPRIIESSALRFKTEAGSVVVAVGGNESAVRGYSPDLLIIDEAAQVADETIYAALPSLGRTNGDLWAMSTPFGFENWFARTWHDDDSFEKTTVTYLDVPDIIPVAEGLRKTMPDAFWRQEFLCEFLTLDEQIVFPTAMIDAAFSDAVPVFWGI